MVDLSIRDFGGQAVVSLSGELDLASIPGVASQLISTMAACGPSVIVDLARLESIGYSGLTVLVRVLKWARRSGGDLCLAAPQEQVLRVLEITGLIDVFPVYPSVEQAASRVRPPSRHQAGRLRPVRRDTCARHRRPRRRPERSRCYRGPRGGAAPGRCGR